MRVVRQTCADGSQSGLLKLHDDGSTRPLPEDDPSYLEWLDAGGVVEILPYVVPDLASLQEAACNRLNATRDRIEYGTFTDSHDNPYDVDARGREKLTGLEAKIANGLILPEGFSWTGADNEEHPHTNATILALTTEILLWTDAVHRACVVAKKAVRAATDAAGVAAAEASVVWPTGGA